MCQRLHEQMQLRMHSAVCWAAAAGSISCVADIASASVQHMCLYTGTYRLPLPAAAAVMVRWWRALVFSVM
jgi:hypothetical protein